MTPTTRTKSSITTYPFPPTLSHVASHFCPSPRWYPLTPITCCCTHCTKAADRHEDQEPGATFLTLVSQCSSQVCIALLGGPRSCSLSSRPHCNNCLFHYNLSSSATRGLSNFTPTYIRWLAECLCRLLPCLQCIDQLGPCWLAGSDQLGSAAHCSPGLQQSMQQPTTLQYMGRAGELGLARYR